MHEPRDRGAHEIPRAVPPTFRPPGGRAAFRDGFGARAVISGKRVRRSRPAPAACPVKQRSGGASDGRTPGEGMHGATWAPLSNHLGIHHLLNWYLKRLPRSHPSRHCHLHVSPGVRVLNSQDGPGASTRRHGHGHSLRVAASHASAHPSTTSRVRLHVLLIRGGCHWSSTSDGRASVGLVQGLDVFNLHVLLRQHAPLHDGNQQVDQVLQFFRDVRRNHPGDTNHPGQHDGEGNDEIVTEGVLPVESRLNHESICTNGNPRTAVRLDTEA
mmetsp:Transcript_24272/g.61778  ORF Transcript_24272/g.61778 Transcript_24272/m.61778 type:complete len:271 (+) Transcript_24272:105-917(+)